MKSNKSISRTFFGQISFLAVSKITKNQFLNWEKSSKLPKMQFHEKKIGFFFISRVFLPGFLKFSDPLYIVEYLCILNSSDI